MIEKNREIEEVAQGERAKEVVYHYHQKMLAFKALKYEYLVKQQKLKAIRHRVDARLKLVVFNALLNDRPESEDNSHIKIVDGL